MACGDAGKGKGRLEPIYISDDGFDNEHFVLPNHYKECIEKVLIPQGLIMDRTEKLAKDIHNAYKGEELHLLCLLKGSRGFFNQLLTNLNRIHTYSSDNCSDSFPPYMEHYVRVKSYSNDQSTESLQVISEDLAVLHDRHVLMVEDIVDTGNTIAKFSRWLANTHEPRSLKVASLLEKRTQRSNGFLGDYVGFSVPDGFVVGFSMDYNEMFRDLIHICILNECGKQKYKEPIKQGEDTAKNNGVPNKHKFTL